MDTLSEFLKQCKRCPFTVPEGYFSTLPARIMQRIDAEIPAEEQLREVSAKEGKR